MNTEAGEIVIHAFEQALNTPKVQDHLEEIIRMVITEESPIEVAG